MAGHARLRKYQIKYRAGYWLARVPYGSWKRFDTWAGASRYLAMRHEERVAKEADRVLKISSERVLSERDA